MFNKIIDYCFQLVLLALPFLLPLFTINDNAGTLLTAVSLLFAILIGFFIATTTSNYLRLQTLIADANASLISLYRIIGIIEPQKKEVVGELIDLYMIKSLDFEFLDYADGTKKEFDQMMTIVDGIEPKDEKGFALFQNLHNTMDNMLRNFQETALTSKRIITPHHWFIVILLAVLLATSLLGFRDGDILINIFVGVMLVGMYRIIVLIHEIDANIFLSRQLSFDDPQQVFSGIGRMDYYPEYALRKGYAKPKTDVYRVGTYTNYPASFDKEITVHNKQV